MRPLLALSIAAVLFLAGAHEVLALAGTGPIGAKCGDTNPRYTGSPVTEGLDFTKATCQTFKYCESHAPLRSDGTPVYYWDPQNPDCAVGCCAYYKVTPPPPPTQGTSKNLFNPISGVTDLYGLIKRVIQLFLGVVGALTFAVFVYSGFVWMTAGSSDRVEAAKSAIRNAAIGLLLIGFSFAITNFIIDALANRGS